MEGRVIHLAALLAGLSLALSAAALAASGLFVRERALRRQEIAWRSLLLAELAKDPRQAVILAPVSLPAGPDAAEAITAGWTHPRALRPSTPLHIATHGGWLN